MKRCRLGVLVAVLLALPALAADVNITLLNGDADLDGQVTLFDYTVVDAAYGKRPGDAGWNANADLNGNNVVDSADYDAIDNNFGQSSAAALTGTSSSPTGKYYATIQVGLSDYVGSARTVNITLRKQGQTTLYNWTTTSGTTLVLRAPSSGVYDGRALSTHFLRYGFTVNFTNQDNTAPNPGTAGCPARVQSGSVTVSYSGASDGESGLKKVELWVKSGSGAWANTGQTRTTGSGSFSYTPPSAGTYYFDLVAEDNVANRSAAASGHGDCSVFYGSTGSCGILSILVP